MKTILIFLVKLYRRLISPLKGNCCRFTPTCSVYALQALEKFGAIRGSILIIWRVLRCNPFCRGGYDPVPERFTLKRQNKTGEK
ncbi:MAG: membrane protein insertion efficiency factor YidD [Clostridia bacterium]|nr:membrane protein insertion efficiency factor YidD [Clostridia bacterium]